MRGQTACRAQHRNQHGHGCDRCRSHYLLSSCPPPHTTQSFASLSQHFSGEAACLAPCFSLISFLHWWLHCRKDPQDQVVVIASLSVESYVFLGEKPLTFPLPPPHALTTPPLTPSKELASWENASQSFFWALHIWLGNKRDPPPMWGRGGETSILSQPSLSGSPSFLTGSLLSHHRHKVGG